MKKLAVIACSWLLLAAGFANAASADEFPVKSIRIVVPFPAGGTTDILARSVAQALGEKLGLTTFVENRAGASGTIGSELVAKSPADGNVLLLTATHQPQSVPQAAL
jgi:tripartite-type tricarboxylate transporter receptor subunit TctC